MLKRGKSSIRNQVPYHLITPKQLVSDCIDHACALLKEIVYVYCTDTNL
jgi:hypothetical protein